jgi:SAM-dependent methyltransferase
VENAVRELRACPVCRSAKVRFDFRAPTTRRPNDGKEWTVLRCAECTHGFMSPQPAWEELAPYYGADYEAYGAAHGASEDDERSARRARIEGHLRHIPLPAGKRLLDVGCGGGRFLRVARLLGATVEGVEPGAWGAEQVKRSGIEVFHGTLEQYCEAGNRGPFDVITMNHVLEHVPDPVRTLSLLRRLLAPAGYAWVAVPNAAYPLARKLRGSWHSTDLPYHLMQFSPASVSRAGRAAGLHVRLQKTESIPAIVAGSLRLYLRYRWKLPRRLTAAVPYIDRVWAPRYARRMDLVCSGEAILTEFTAS